MSSIGDQGERVRENSEDDFENDKTEIQCDPNREGGPETLWRMGVFAAVTRRMVVQAHLRSNFMITSCRSSIGRKSSWLTCNRTCRPSSHNSICPPSCRLFGRSSSAPRRTRCLQATLRRRQRLISFCSFSHLLSFISYKSQIK